MAKIPISVSSVSTFRILFRFQKIVWVISVCPPFIDTVTCCNGSLWRWYERGRYRGVSPFSYFSLSHSFLPFCLSILALILPSPPSSHLPPHFLQSLSPFSLSPVLLHLRLKHTHYQLTAIQARTQRGTRVQSLSKLFQTWFSRMMLFDFRKS